MSRYPMKVERDDGERFVLVCGTDHASPNLGMEPHCYAQIFDADEDDVLWSADALTPDALAAALDGNPILKLGHFRGPHGGDPPPGGERWLTEYATDLFTREMRGM